MLDRLLEYPTKASSRKVIPSPRSGDDVIAMKKAKLLNMGSAFDRSAQRAPLRSGDQCPRERSEMASPAALLAQRLEHRFAQGRSGVGRRQYEHQRNAATTLGSVGLPRARRFPPAIRCFPALRGAAAAGRPFQIALVDIDLPDLKESALGACDQSRSHVQQLASHRDDVIAAARRWNHLA